jgi:hypothetical protein
MVKPETASVSFLVALALAFLLDLASACNADLNPVMITGVCAKSTLKDAQSCQEVLVAHEGARSSQTTFTESVRVEGRTDPN